MHGAFTADIAKEALIIGGGVAVDIEVFDGFSVAVKGANVLMGIVADWVPGVRFSTDVFEVDVVHQLGVGAGTCSAAVDEVAEVSSWVAVKISYGWSSLPSSS